MTPAVAYDQLFAAVDGYGIAARGKEHLGLGADPGFTYGEASLPGMEQIIATLGEGARGTFYDLGSGTGKAVILAAMLGAFERCIGIEFVPELHETALSIGREFDAVIRPSLPQEKQRVAVEFRNEDVFLADIRDGDVFLAHCCTCFTEEQMQKLQRSLLAIRPGALALMVSRSLPEGPFALAGSFPVQMGWGTATVYVYRRN
jgi:SAM-dependent methyltransferase